MIDWRATPNSLDSLLLRPLQASRMIRSWNPGGYEDRLAKIDSFALGSTPSP